MLSACRVLALLGSFIVAPHAAFAAPGEQALPESFGAKGDLQQKSLVVHATAENCEIDIDGGAFVPDDVGKQFEAEGLGAEHEDGALAEIEITEHGSGYIEPPLIRLQGPLQYGTAIEANLGVVGAVVDLPGNGYPNGLQVLRLFGDLPNKLTLVKVRAAEGHIVAVEGIISSGAFRSPIQGGIPAVADAGSGATLKLSWGVTGAEILGSGKGLPIKSVRAEIVDRDGAPPPKIRARLSSLHIKPRVDPIVARITAVNSASRITLSRCPATATSKRRLIAWGSDDTVAVQAAAASGLSVYLSKSYLVAHTVFMRNGVLSGGGASTSYLYGSSALPPQDPILRISRTVVLRDFAVGYVGPAISDTEDVGERVAIASAAELSVQRGSSIGNLAIFHVGTGLYAERNANVFSATLHSLEVSDFSFRGVDFSGESRTGNIYANIYISSSRPNADRGFSLEGEESESRIDQINVEHSVLNTAIYIDGVRGLSAGTIHLEGDQQRNPSTAFLKIQNTSGSIDVLTFLNMRSTLVNPWLLELGDSAPRHGVDNNQCRNRLRIGVLFVQGLNSPYWNSYPSWPRGLHNLIRPALIGRRKAAIGRYVIAVDQYEWLSYEGGADSSLYERPVINPNGNIDYEKFDTILATAQAESKYDCRLRQ